MNWLCLFFFFSNLEKTFLPNIDKSCKYLNFSYSNMLLIKFTYDNFQKLIREINISHNLFIRNCQNLRQGSKSSIESATCNK